MNEPLTDEQIENWRRVMVSVIGTYALIMSKEEIQLLRDRMQAKSNEIESGKNRDTQNTEERLRDGAGKVQGE